MAEKKIRTPDDIESFDPAAAHEALQEGSVLKHVSSTHDAVFGEVTEGGPNYRSVGWLGTVALMLKTQIGLGVLSIPAVFDTLGLVPGAIILCVVAGIATWTSYVVGVFKLNHREVYGMDDATDCDQDWIFVAGSGILGVSIGLNAVSSHGACTAIFVVVAAIAGFFLASIRTLGKISWLAWLGLACILVAVLLVTISVGIQDRPSLAPQVGPWTSDYRVTNSPSFTDGVSAVSSLIFACSATPAYFQLAAEMRDPRFFTRALVVSQTCSTVLYLVVGIVVYYYCGSYVSSPALGSAGPLIKKIAYGIALPGLLASTTIVLHLPSKYIFVRLLRGSRHLTSNSVVHWCTWLACTLGASIIAYLIASGIPFFNDLVSLIGALLGTFLAYQPTGCMWFYDNWHSRSRSGRWMLLATWSGLIIVVGCFMTVAGTYGSIVSIIDSLRADGGTKPWTCADNSNS
ncbi:putative amino acid transporter [Aspergillus japonicus CBS 114.51]|uniref:Putative amino acid transporter n=1 Tax=Aspergillus japonicus CBS 114.51 TaxID=1448312 RepID=A0A8T8X051_ASPJA|nr:putative amino acid transporter [Aspergillus japonicus CBS 114.51]RAH81526.1 putative amino acid transporter [Aspergillus japonicus CBS 114.51]